MEGAEYGIATTRAFAKANPDLVKQFVAGTLEGTKFLKNDKNAAVKIGAKSFEEAEELTALAYDEFSKHYVDSGRWDEEGLKKAVDFYAKAAKVPAPDLKTLVDTQFLP